MRKIIFILLATGAFLSCTKKYNTTNNYYVTPAPAQPAFLVEGISNISLINDISTSAVLNITVQYEDSAQENVTLSVSGLPAGVVIDTGWVSRGIPTFSTVLTVYDTTALGAVPGKYTLNLAATTASGKKKSYPFALTISTVPTAFFGKYAACSSTCTGTAYSDSVYADPTTANRVWFKNFGNTGNMVFGSFTSGGTLIIPMQTSGGITYSGTSTGTLDFTGHHLNINYYAGSSSSCSVDMQ